MVGFKGFVLYQKFVYICCIPPKPDKPNCICICECGT